MSWRVVTVSSHGQASTQTAAATSPRPPQKRHPARAKRSTATTAWAASMKPMVKLAPRPISAASA